MRDETRKNPSVGGTLDELVGQLNCDLLERVDQLYRDAISRVIGDDWGIDDMAGRLEQERVLHSKMKTVLLDGKPILEIHDPEAGIRDGTVFFSTVKYRVLV